MSLPITGTFSSPNAGKLTVTLSGQFSYLEGDAGFPSTGGSNISMRGYIGPSGSPTYTGIVEKFSTTSVLTLDYPGGNVAWPCGIEEVSHSTPSGIYHFAFSNIKLDIKLQKK